MDTTAHDALLVDSASPVTRLAARLGRKSLLSDTLSPANGSRVSDFRASHAGAASRVSGVLDRDAQILTPMISTPQCGGSVPHLSQDASPQPTPFFQQRLERCMPQASSSSASGHSRSGQSARGSLKARRQRRGPSASADFDGNKENMAQQQLQDQSQGLTKAKRKLYCGSSPGVSGCKTASKRQRPMYQSMPDSLKLRRPSSADAAIQGSECKSGHMFAGRASSLGAGLRHRRNSSGVTDKLTDRPPLIPWCNASHGGRLSQQSLFTDSPQDNFELRDKAHPSPAPSTHLQIAAANQSLSVELMQLQQPNLYTDLACSQTHVIRAQPRHLQNPDVIQMQHMIPSHGSVVAVDPIGIAVQPQQQLATCLQSLPTVSDTCPFASHLPAISPVAACMEIDSSSGDAQQQAAAMQPVACNSSPAECSQTLPCSTATPQGLTQSFELPQSGATWQLQTLGESGRRRSFSPLSRGTESVLPMTENSESGVPSISCSTLAQLLSGQHTFDVASLHIIDCRYPYEHVGGHIPGAVNIPSPDAAEQFTFGSNLQGSAAAIVFYCEFSSERAPRMFRHLRNLDRRQHLKTYPMLKFPHMYVLQGGYKAFLQSFPAMCQPEHAYIRMHDAAYRQEYKTCKRHIKAAWASVSSRNASAFGQV